MAIPEDLKQAIIDDLKEDRLSFEEIAAKRLGNPKKKNIIGNIANANGYSRKDRRGKSRRSHVPKVTTGKSSTAKPIEIVTFGPEKRLSLIDEAITIHKSLLPSITDAYKMEKWSAALDRLLEQRRIEEPTDPNDTEQDMLDKIVGALDQHAASVSPQASPSISGLPEDPPNPDVRLGEERQNRDSTVLRNQGD